MKAKFYISALSVNSENGENISPKGEEFIEALKKAGYQIYMPLKWREYSEIEKEIDKYGALIALIDDYWTSSTWKVSELTYSLNGVGADEVKPIGKPLPTFVFWIDKPLDLAFLRHLNEPIYLSRKVSQAIKEIERYLLRPNQHRITNQ